MTSFLSLHDAVAEYVHDGATIAMEGFTHLIPFAAGHEIIRQQKRDLCLVRMTPDLLYDQLIGMGCARKLYKSDRILPEETTVLCITGNGLKTTDVLIDEYEQGLPIAPKLAEFEKLLGQYELPVAVGA